MEDTIAGFLPETRNNLEKNVGVTIDKIDNSDLCEMERHIRKDTAKSASPEVIRKTRNTYISMRRILTSEEYERKLRKLFNRYYI